MPALLWDPEIHPRLPQPRLTGRARRSPHAGRVVVWRRGTCTDGVLACTLISVVVWDDMKPEMVALFSTVRRAVLRGTTRHVVRWIEGTGQEQIGYGVRVGYHALVAAREDRISLGEGRMRVYPPSREKARGRSLVSGRAPRPHLQTFGLRTSVDCTTVWWFCWFC